MRAIRWMGGITLVAVLGLGACDDEGDVRQDAAARDAAGVDAPASDVRPSSDAPAADTAHASDAPVMPDAAADAAADAVVGGQDAYLPSCGARVEISAGQVYGSYVVEAIVLQDAGPGVYTFGSSGAAATSVQLRKGDVLVASVDYDWRDTIYADVAKPAYEFVFPNHLTLKVRKAGSGTVNLYDIGVDLFDGCHQFTAP